MSLGKNSTAEQALGGQSLKGRLAIVTGANSGIGVETARVLALAGADVILACRSAEAGARVAADLAAALPAGAGKLSAERLDLSDLAAVSAFAAAFLARGVPLHLLINNAGIMATPLGFTAQGFEQQMGTNHLGHFLLTRLLRGPLEAAQGARVVNLSSDLHKSGTAEGVLATLEGDPRYEKRKYKPFGAYGDSKLANVLFTRALARRLPPGALTFAVHPGVIPTNLSRSMGIGGALFRVLGRPFLKSVPQGAATTVFGATSPELAGRSGAYLADCRVVEPSSYGRDDALAERVFAISERLVADFLNK